MIGNHQGQLYLGVPLSGSYYRPCRQMIKVTIMTDKEFSDTILYDMPLYRIL